MVKNHVQIVNGWTSKSYRKLGDFKYLESVDSLRPVLAHLNKEQWINLENRLVDLLYKDKNYSGNLLGEFEFCLKLDPRVLATEIYGVIKSV